MVELAGRPATGCEHLERPPDQSGSFLVDLDGAYLPPEVVAHADVAVADRRLRHCAALRGLLRQAFDDLSGEVAGVELGNRGHDAVQQHPRWSLVDVLRRRHERDAGVLECEVDGHVVGAIAGEPVDLVDDAVVRLVLRDVLNHPHQFGPVGLPRGLASVDELLDDRCAELVGLALVRLALRRDREALRLATLLRLLLRGDPQVRDGERSGERGWRYEAVYRGAVRVDDRHGSSPQSLVLPTRTCESGC
nr:hypothetical protein [Rhodococcus pyridinivorans]